MNMQSGTSYVIINLFMNICSEIKHFYRLDTLMGGDFQQYRANVSCGRADCSYASTIGKILNIYYCHVL